MQEYIVVNSIEMIHISYYIILIYIYVCICQTTFSCLAAKEEMLHLIVQKIQALPHGFLSLKKRH